MIFKSPHRLTHIDIWFPRYKDKHGNLAEPVVLVAQYKIEQASPWIIIEFTKAKHLMGQRFCIERAKCEQYPLDSNTKIPCRAIPLSKLERWDTVADIKETIASFGW